MKTSHPYRPNRIARLFSLLMLLLAATGHLSAQSVYLQFPNNPVSDILAVYERISGKNLIKDSNIFTGPPISLVCLEPVDEAEAIRLIEAALQLNGYLLIHDSSTSVKVINSQVATSARYVDGIPFHTDMDQLPEGEVMVTFFMGLETIDPSDAATIMSTHINLHPFGRLTAISSPPGILVTENASVVRKLIRLKEIIDTEFEGEAVVTRFIQINQGEASEIAELVQLAITATSSSSRPSTQVRSTNQNRSTNQARPTNQSRTTANQARPTQGGGNNQTNTQGAANQNTLANRLAQFRQFQQQQRQSGQGSRTVGPSQSDTLLGVEAQILPDDRLNRILVICDDRDFPLIAALIAEFDQPAVIQKPYQRRLKYISAGEILPILTDVLADAGLGESVQNIQTNRIRTTGSTATQGTTRGGASSGITSRPDQLAAPVQETTPLSVLVGKTRIIADRQANAIIVMGLQESITRIDDIIDRLDHKPPQVYLATVIGQLTLEDGFEFGVNYVREFMLNSDGTGGSGSFLTDGIAGGSIDDVQDNITNAIPAPNGLNLYGSFTGGLDVFINALESTDRFQVLSRPAVYAANNRKAVITSGQRIPVPTSSLTTTSDRNDTANIRTNIEFRDVVLKLEVIPLINADRDVTLQIAQVNDTVIGEQVVSGESIPIIGTEELNTTVTIPNQTTVVLGGLIAEQEDEEESGIPFLSRIPVLGYAFKNTKVKVSRKELIIFIQPIVVEDDLALAEASANEAARSQLGSAPATFDIPQPDPNEEPGPDAQPQRKLPRLRHP